MGRVVKVDAEDANNGPGIRVVVWFSGCEHACPGCHNWDWAQDSSLGDELDDNLIESILEKLAHQAIKGLSLSGGDPMAPYNYESAIRLLKAVRERFGISRDVWMWTGYRLHQLSEELTKSNLVDYIVDGKFVKNLMMKQILLRGSANQTIWYNDPDLMSWYDVTSKYGIRAPK